MKNACVVLMLMIASQVSAQKASVTYDKTDSTDVSAFKTFNFQRVEVNAVPERQVTNEGIKMLNTAIEEQMTLRGFQLVKDNPDIIINMGITIVQKDQTRETDFTVDRPKYMGQRNYQWESEEIKTGQQYEEGTLVCDFIDANANTMFWQANVVSVLKKEASAKRVNKAIAKLFKKFPVKAPK